MKKMINRGKIAAALLFAVLLFVMPVLFSCKDASENKNGTVADGGLLAKELADAILAAYDKTDLPEAGFEHFYSEADDTGEEFLDSKYAGLLINGAYSELEEYESLKNFAFYIPIGRYMFEIDVIKAGAGDNMSELKSVLEKRLQNKKSSDILTYQAADAPIIDNAKIVTSGNFLILVATQDNSKADKIIAEMTE